MKKMFLATLLTVLTGMANAQAQNLPTTGYDPQVINLEVAFAGPNLQVLTQQTVTLLKRIGRQVTDVTVTATFGTGRPAAVRITHVLPEPPKPCAQPMQQSFGVNFLTAFFERANEVLGYLQMANKRVMGFAITSTFGTGKPAGGVFYYCNSN